MSANIKNKAKRLNSVRKITSHANEVSTQALRKLFTKHAQEESKLIELIGFRKEYQDRNLPGLSKNCSTIQQAQNNRRFLNELSMAINLQQEKIVMLVKEIESAIDIWKQSRQRNKAVEKLINGYRRQYAKSMNRLEQISADERMMRSQYKVSQMLR